MVPVVVVRPEVPLRLAVLGAPKRKIILVEGVHLHLQAFWFLA